MFLKIHETSHLDPEFICLGSFQYGLEFLKSTNGNFHILPCDKFHRLYTHGVVKY